MSSNLFKIHSDVDFKDIFEQLCSESEGRKLTVLYFTASWCRPCAAIAPVFDAVVKKNPNSNFLKIDIDECNETGTSHEINSVPTFICFIGRTKVYQFTSADPHLLESKVAELAARSGDCLIEGDVKKFQDVCNCSEEEAKHYLSAFSNDLEAAISSYLSEIVGEDIPETTEPNLQIDNSTSNDMNNRKKFGTLSSLLGPKTVGSSNNEDDEEGQAFYVGGSEGGGGQQVLGPKKDKKVISAGNNEELVSKLFENAKKAGAEVLESARVEDPAKPKTKVFSGTAFVLGNDLSQPSTMIPGSSSSTSEESKPITIKMWNNGFSLDDGPLREFTDPASKEFLNSIQRGQVPHELLKSSRNGQANVMLEDHRNEDYKAPPKPKIIPFSGTGQMLGGPSPKFLDTHENSALDIPAPPAPIVDKTKPTTKLQVRLTDGSKLLVELNHDQTVADIRNSILNQRPQLMNTSFIIMTNFPKKELSDDSLKLVDGNLLNCALILK